MGVSIHRTDIHEEIVAGDVVPVQHAFEARPRARQHLLLVGSEPALVEGDSFTNEHLSDHRLPKHGTFAVRPSGQGRFTKAGQALLLVAGKHVVTQAGSLSTCCIMFPEALCHAVVYLTNKPLFFINESPILTGQTI